MADLIRHCHDDMALLPGSEGADTKPLRTLPVMASLFGSGDPIRNIPSMVGWATFTAEHALFGLVVGVMALNLGTRTIDVTFGAHEGGGQSTGRGTHERAT